MRTWKSLVTGVSLAFLALGARAAEVGIYAPEPLGGRSAGGMAIKATLEEAGIGVENFSRLSLKDLLAYKVVIIPGVSELPREEGPTWSKNLRAYVTRCGGAAVLCHDAVGADRSPVGKENLFPEVVAPGSVEHRIDRETRSPAKVKVKVAVSAGIVLPPDYARDQEKEHMYYDHFSFATANGKVVLSDAETGKAVMALAEVDSGRVVCDGMLGRNAMGPAARLEGVDRDAMIGAVKWCLSGKGLIVTDPRQVKLEEWRPKAKAAAPSSKVAVIGTLDYDIRHRAATKIAEAGIDHDYVAIEFLESRDLVDEGYKLIIVFPPRSWEETLTPDGAYDKIREYIEAGGKAIVYLPGNIGAKAERRFLSPIGAKKGKCFRDNIENLREIAFVGPDGKPCRFQEIPENWFTMVSEPNAAATKVAGWWLNDRGEKVAPAIVETRFGYTVNLNTTGQNNKIFVANAAVSLAPEIGPAVFGKLSKTYDEEKALVAAAALSDRGKEFFAKAEQSRTAAETAAKNGNFIEANGRILEGEDALVRAYAVSMPSPRDELRMVCVHVRDILEPEKVCERLSRAGFNGVTLMGVERLYPSKRRAPKDAENKTDELRRWIDEAHKRGLKIGPTFPTFRIEEGSEIFERARAEDWRIVTAEMVGRAPRPIKQMGSTDICRSHPEIVAYAVEKSSEVIKNYPVDFVIYDYIRWGEACYCETCRKRFQERSGLKIEKWPNDAMGKYQKEYNDFRASPVTEVVREVARNIAAVNPKIKLGVFTRGPRSVSWGQGQYWWEWGDLADYLMPMLYGPNNEELEKVAQEYNALVPPAKNRAKLVPALAPPGAKGGSDLVRLRQIDLARKYAPTGMMYFWYHGLSDAYLDLLRVGPFRDK